jgi:hypothetical protein
MMPAVSAVEHGLAMDRRMAKFKSNSFVRHLASRLAKA